MSKSIQALQAERAEKIAAAEKLLPTDDTQTMSAEAQAQAGELLAAAEKLQGDIDAAVKAQAAVQDMRNKLTKATTRHRSSGDMPGLSLDLAP